MYTGQNTVNKKPRHSCFIKEQIELELMISPKGEKQSSSCLFAGILSMNLSAVFKETVRAWRRR